jgi:translation initiation factor IF-2
MRPHVVDAEEPCPERQRCDVRPHRAVHPRRGLGDAADLADEPLARGADEQRPPEWRSRGSPASAASECALVFANPTPGSSTTASRSTPAATDSAIAASSSAATSATGSSPYAACAYVAMSATRPRECMSTSPARASATVRPIASSRRSPLTSLTTSTPASRAARATSALTVSTEITAAAAARARPAPPGPPAPAPRPRAPARRCAAACSPRPRRPRPPLIEQPLGVPHGRVERGVPPAVAEAVGRDVDDAEHERAIERHHPRRESPDGRAPGARRDRPVLARASPSAAVR